MQSESTNLGTIKSDWLKCNLRRIGNNYFTGFWNSFESQTDCKLESPRLCESRVANIGESIQNSIGKRQSNKFNRYQGRARLISKSFRICKSNRNKQNLNSQNKEATPEPLPTASASSQNRCLTTSATLLLPLDCSSSINISIIHSVWLSHLSQEVKQGARGKKKPAEIGESCDVTEWKAEERKLEKQASTEIETRSERSQ